MQADLVAIGKITKPHGVRGDLKAEAYFQLGEILSRCPQLRLRKADQAYSFSVKRYRQRGRSIILKLAGIEDVQSAESYRGWEIAVSVEELPDLPGDQYYTFQLLGLEVITEAGEVVGRIDEVLPMPAHDVWVVKRGSEQLLIPAVKAIVSQVDLKRRRVIVRDVSGLLE